MNILLATDVFPPRSGGSGWSTYYLARALRARGHRVTIARPREGLRGARVAAYDGLPVHELGLPRITLPLVRGIVRQGRFWPRFTRFLIGLAREIGADVVHGQHLLSIPAAVAAGRALGLPAFATVRDYWPTCPIGTRLRRCPGTAHCATACQVCCLARGQTVLQPVVRALLPYVRANLARRQRALRDADRVIAVSNHVASVLRAGIPGLEPVVIPNFIEMQAESGRENGAERGPRSRTILYVGKLEEHKGADLLPLAAAAVPDARLIVAGDGPLADQVRRECAAHGVTADFLGERPNAEVLGLMREAAVLLFPARWEEPLSRALLEAGSVGLPVVALATGGTPDIIVDGETGVLAQRPADLGPALAALFADPARRDRLGAAARARIAAHFAEDVVVPRVEQLYREGRGSRVAGLNVGTSNV